MATLGSGNVPSSLARRLAAGHADKDAHDADEWRKWRRDRIFGRERDRRGRLRRIDYCDVSPKAAKIIDRMRVPGPGGDASSIFEPDCQRVGASFRNKAVKSRRRKRHSRGWSPSMGPPGVLRAQPAGTQSKVS